MNPTPISGWESVAPGDDTHGVIRCRELQPEDVDARVSAQGQPVAAGMPFIVVHCFTNR